MQNPLTPPQSPHNGVMTANPMKSQLLMIPDLANLASFKRAKNRRRVAPQLTQR